MSTAIHLRSGRSPGTVLIVDDEPANRELFRGALEGHGHRVQDAPSGEVALELIGEVGPDAVVLDVMMPGIDGFEVCRRLKSDAETASIPVLMVTALADRDSRLEGIRAGADDFLSKPVDFQELALRVGNAVFTKHLFDENREFQRDLERKVAAQTVELRQAHDRLQFQVAELDARDRLFHFQMTGAGLEQAYAEVLAAFAQVFGFGALQLFCPDADEARLVAVAAGSSAMAGHVDLWRDLERIAPVPTGAPLLEARCFSERRLVYEHEGRRIAAPLLYRDEAMGVVLASDVAAAVMDDERRAEIARDVLLNAFWRMAREAAAVLRMARANDDLASGRADVSGLLALEI